MQYNINGRVVISINSKLFYFSCKENGKKMNCDALIDLGFVPKSAAEDECCKK